MKVQGHSAISRSGLLSRIYAVGAPGFEPETVKPKPIENKDLAERQEPAANTYANIFSENPLQKLAQAWETLPPETQASITALIDQIIEQK